MGKRFGFASAVICMALLFGACSSAGEQVQEKIAKQAQTQLKLATLPKAVCPKNAKAKKGETFTCTLTIEGQELPIKITFVKDDTFKGTVDGEVEKVADVESKLKTQSGADTFKCDTTKTLFIITAKASLKCTATKGTDSQSIKLTWDGTQVKISQA